jgi:phytanoyl-CoA hydroxylase
LIVTPDRRSQLEADGYFILESFFAPSEIAALTAAIDVHAGRHDQTLLQTGTQGISRPGEIAFTAHLAEQDPAIAAFCKQPQMVQLVKELIGPNVRLYWDQSVYKRPETPREFPWHQDNGYTPVEPEQYFTCWLALTDATLENGCIWVLPSSHKDGVRPHKPSPIGLVGYDGTEAGLPVPLRSGSMAVFSSLLLHKSGPNVTQDETRKAYVIQYCHANTRLLKTGELLEDRMWVVRDGAAA